MIYAMNPYDKDKDAHLRDPYTSKVAEFRRAFGVHTPADFEFQKLTPEQEKELNTLLSHLREVAHLARSLSKKYDGKVEQFSRAQLMTEELFEVIEAIGRRDGAALTAELSDLMYVTVGSALGFGLGAFLLPMFEEIHRANMSKLSPEGKPFYDDSGKITKGPHYVKPNLINVVNEVRGLRKLASS